MSLEIRDIVKVIPYRDLKDLVQPCIKVEQQNLRNLSQVASIVLWQRLGELSHNQISVFGMLHSWVERVAL